MFHSIVKSEIKISCLTACKIFLNSIELEMSYVVLSKDCVLSNPIPASAVSYNEDFYSIVTFSLATNLNISEKALPVFVIFSNTAHPPVPYSLTLIRSPTEIKYSGS